MSFSLGIHLWWKDDADLSPSMVRSVLKCVAERAERPFRDTQEEPLPKFQSLQVFEKCFEEVRSETVETDDLNLVTASLGELRENSCYVISMWIKQLEYESREDEIVESVAGLDVVFFRSGVLFGGHILQDPRTSPNQYSQR